MVLKTYQELISYKENLSKTYLNYDINQLLKLPSYSGVLSLKFEEKDFKYINICNDDGGILKFFWQGEPEIISMKLWCSIVNTKNFGLDIGANTGRYSVIGGKYGGDIISIEPYYINYCRLIDNLKINNLNYLNTLMLGLSDTNKEGYLKVKSPLYYKSAGGKISNEGNIIRLTKLDNINFKKKINIMKVDVEGHELEVINGSLKIIKNDAPFILLEYNQKNFNEILNILKKLYDYEHLYIDDKNKKIFSDNGISKKDDFNGNVFFYQKNQFKKFNNILSEYI